MRDSSTKTRNSGCEFLWIINKRVKFVTSCYSDRASCERSESDEKRRLDDGLKFRVELKRRRLSCGVPRIKGIWVIGIGGRSVYFRLFRCWPFFSRLLFPPRAVASGLFRPRGRIFVLDPSKLTVSSSLPIFDVISWLFEKIVALYELGITNLFQRMFMKVICK